jgi:single-stranded DNA-binding protein
MAANNSNKNRPSNYVILTLRAVTDGESKFAQSGKPWAKVRAFLSQGKDKDTGEYKPSVFFDVLAFSKDERMSDPCAAISQIAKKDMLTVKGNLAMEEWTGKEDGVKHQQLTIFASSVEPFVFADNAQTETEDVLEGEPA